jgi:beta-galactosidase
MSGAATDFKVRMAILQGNRMLSHYTFAAGINPKLEVSHHDGNDRIGTGGEQHDPSSAPIRIDGSLDPIYFTTRDTNRTILAVGDLLADMDEEYDDVRFGFLPDYYTTDLKHKGPMNELSDKLVGARNRIDSLMRPMLDACLGFTGINLQEEIPAGTHCIVLSCAPCLQTEVQQRLVRFVERGGRLLLFGRIPVEDLEGRSATVLADALGIRAGEEISSTGKYLALHGLGWAAHNPEMATWQVQAFKVHRGEPFFQTVQYGDLCAATIPLGRGKAVVMSCEPPNHPQIWKGVFAQLDLKPSLSHDYGFGGLTIQRVKDRKGQRFISVINLDLLDKEFTLRENGTALFGGKLSLAGKKAKLLPINVRVGGLKIRWSTAEITEVIRDGVRFRQSQTEERAVFDGQIRTESGTIASSTSATETAVSFPPGTGSVLVRPA